MAMQLKVALQVFLFQLGCQGLSSIRY